MSLVRFLVMIAVGTLLAWVAWVAVVLTIDPLSGGPIAHALFYTSLFLSLSGTLTLIGFFVRHWWEKDPLPFRQIAFALRQGIIISLTIIVALGLQAGRILSVWMAILIVLIAFATEAFFLAGQSRRSRPQV